jgi:hypothetical protein
MSAKENEFLKDRPDAEVPVLKGADVEVINAVTALLKEQRRFDRETVTKFKKLFGDGGLKWWIVGAGVGGAVELLRLTVDVGRFLWEHLH